jgi:hypothetical protein
VDEWIEAGVEKIAAAAHAKSKSGFFGLFSAIHFLAMKSLRLDPPSRSAAFAPADGPAASS